MNKLLCASLFSLLLCGSTSLVYADADDAPSAYYDTGPFGTLNPQSKYYTDWFPEPLRVEDTAIDNELRFDWEHDEGRGTIDNFLTAEVQKSIGIFTFEVQAPYIITTGAGPSTAIGGGTGTGGASGGDADDGGDGDDAVAAGSGRTQGFGSVELAARLPLLQNLSKAGFIDNSLGFNLEFDVPTNTVVGKNAQIAPGLFDDLAIGDQFSVQTLFSFTHTFGTYPTGRASFGYGLAFGYAIEDEDFSVPHVERLVPSVELVGNTVLDGSLAGQDALTGTAGLRAELKSIGNLEPSFGVGYVFPIDSGGRDQLRWGIITSLTVDF